MKNFVVSHSENQTWTEEFRGKRAIGNLIYVLAYVATIAGLVTFYLSLE